VMSRGRRDLLRYFRQETSRLAPSFPGIAEKYLHRFLEVLRSFRPFSKLSLLCHERYVRRVLGISGSPSR